MNDLWEPLVGDWSLRKLAVAGRPEWALQYRGMDWIKITEFLGAGNPTLDDEMKQFAADLRAAVVAERRLYHDSQWRQLQEANAEIERLRKVRDDNARIAAENGAEIERLTAALRRIAALDEATGHELRERHAFEAVAIANAVLRDAS